MKSFMRGIIAMASIPGAAPARRITAAGQDTSGVRLTSLILLTSFLATARPFEVAPPSPLHLTRAGRLHRHRPCRPRPGLQLKSLKDFLHADETSGQSHLKFLPG